jgi:DNA polymerase elongation subunit (family B)
MYDDTIISLEEITYESSRYVYDLTTENHHFAAGIGEIIVHNTDSVFFTFNLMNPATKEPIRGKKALEITIELAQEVAGICSRFLISPMELCYEKTLMPFILLSKKRYVGTLYELNPNKGKLKFMGLSLKRRDACDYLKDTFGKILNILMSSGILDAMMFLEHSLEQLMNGNVPMEKLKISKSLKSDYKRPETIGHKVLADRIGERDPGNKPKSGDRIDYVFIVNESNSTGKKKLVGDRIETPSFIIENNLQIDYNYYITNQLMKPLLQLFGLALEEIWKSKGKTIAIKKFRKEMSELLEACNNDIEIFMKKKEKITSKHIKQLLFDKWLIEISRMASGHKPISVWFNHCAK